MIFSQLLFFGFFFISIVSSLVYAFLILSYKRGWSRLESNSLDLHSFPEVSVIIACRNEEKSVEKLIENLLLQSYPRENYEIIMIDDFSTDNTYQILQKYTEKIKILSSPIPGKKNAIACGIEMARGELILTTDADCVVPKKWVESHVSLYQEKKTFLQLGLVDFISETPMQKIFTLEFYSLIGSAAGSAGTGKPILGNAANMAFSKEIYCRIKNSINLIIPSGDDVFLLEEMKKQYPDKIAFLKSKDCIVKTPPPQNISEFINQRIRWASKNKYYTDKDIKSAGIIVFTVNMLIFFSLLLIPFDIKYLIIFLSVLFVKSLVDYSFLLKIASFFYKRNLLKYFSFVQIIYPLYVVIIGLLSFFVKYNWKGRKY